MEEEDKDEEKYTVIMGVVGTVGATAHRCTGAVLALGPCSRTDNDTICELSLGLSRLTPPPHTHARAHTHNLSLHPLVLVLSREPPRPEGHLHKHPPFPYESTGHRRCNLAKSQKPWGMPRHMFYQPAIHTNVLAYAARAAVSPSGSVKTGSGHWETITAAEEETRD